MATLFKVRQVNHNCTEATWEEVKPKNGTDFTLEELQEFVGGYIEIITLGGGKIMVVNEEGWLLNLPPNWAATTRYGLGSVIAGNALVCNDEEVQ